MRHPAGQRSREPRKVALGLAWVSLLGLACFAPRPPRGAPCDPLNPCPSGQVCVEDVCGGPQAASDAGADALGDASAIMDRDRDQIADGADNCPDAGNPDQGDEDVDLVGDACDACPIDVSTADPDGDGVAGSCDPRPTMGGDTIVAFDGFHRALPATWEVIGTSVQSGDELVLTTVANNHTAVTPPVLSIANGTITASVIVDATVGNEDAATAVMIPYDPVSDEGIFCELYAPSAGSANGRRISLYDSPADEERGVRGFVWSTATPYLLALTRNGTSYACSVTAAGGAPQTATGTSISMPAQPKVGVAVYGANAHVAWLLVVSSP